MEKIKKYSKEQLLNVQPLLSDKEMHNLFGGYVQVGDYFVFTIDEINQYFSNGNIPSEFESFYYLDSVSEQGDEFNFTHYYRISISNYEQLYGSDDIWDVIDPSNSSNDFSFDFPSEWYSSGSGSSSGSGGSGTSPDGSQGSSSWYSPETNQEEADLLAEALVDHMTYNYFTGFPIADNYKRQIKTRLSTLIRNIDDIWHTRFSFERSIDTVYLNVWNELQSGFIARFAFDLTNQTINEL